MLMLMRTPFFFHAADEDDKSDDADADTGFAAAAGEVAVWISLSVVGLVALRGVLLLSMVAQARAQYISHGCSSSGSCLLYQLVSTPMLRLVLMLRLMLRLVFMLVLTLVLLVMLTLLSNACSRCSSSPATESWTCTYAFEQARK